ncbi:hypothetical protein SLEP1_g9949 [Rubroshorea leprosula]|nr:hypothetical protein SLEP1_g9949 [Rubroshorea leprosula]
MHEILSLGPERNPVNFAINGNGSVRRYASMYAAPSWFF